MRLLSPVTYSHRRPGLGTVGLLALLAASGGAFATLAFPPVRLPGAGVVGAAIGLWSCARAASLRQGALVGLAWGVGFSGILFRWTLELTGAAYATLAGTQAVFWVLTGAVAGWSARRMRPGPWVVTVTATWTLVEVLRGRWPLGGFEWGQLGLAMAELPVRHAAAVVGTIGVTALSIGVAASLVAFTLPDTGRRRWMPLAVTAVAMVVLTVAGSLSWTASAGGLGVAVVQVDDPCPGQFAVDCPDLRTELERRFAAGTAALAGEPGLVLWGEGALAGESLEVLGREVVQRTGGLPAPLLAGATTPAGPGRFLNWNVLFAPDGDVLDAYAKRQPVPFGEYVPFRGLLGGIAGVGRLVPSDMVRGEDPSPLTLPTADGVVKLATVVSWEVTFSRLVREASRGSGAVTTLTTQATYGMTPVSDQLLGTAQMRAAELQKGVVVAATTGRSAVIGPGGDLEEITELFAADLLERDLSLRIGETPYARWGELPVIVLAAVALLWGPLRQLATTSGRAAPRGAEPARMAEAGAVAEEAPGVGAAKSPSDGARGC